MKQTTYPKTFLIRLTEELHSWTAQEAAKMGISQSAFIRMTLSSVKERIDYSERKKLERTNLR